MSREEKGASAFGQVKKLETYEQDRPSNQGRLFFSIAAVSKYNPCQSWLNGVG